MRKDRALVKIIEVENPVSAIIFCNTKVNTHYVSEVLKRFGYDADELSSDLGQGAREKVMARARAGKLRFLVATDVAARGIDIPDLSHVFLYEPPEDQEAYIHRAGRTGRAGASGVAISLVAGMEEIEIRRIAKAYHIDIQERPSPPTKRWRRSCPSASRPSWRPPSRPGLRPGRAHAALRTPGLEPGPDGGRARGHRHAPGRDVPADPPRRARSGGERAQAAPRLRAPGGEAPQLRKARGGGGR